MHSAFVVEVIGAKLHALAAQFDVVFIIHPVIQVSLHEASNNYYGQALAEQAASPTKNPQYNPAVSLDNKQLTREV